MLVYERLCAVVLYWYFSCAVFLMLHGMAQRSSVCPSVPVELAYSVRTGKLAHLRGKLNGTTAGYGGPAYRFRSDFWVVWMTPITTVHSMAEHLKT